MKQGEETLDNELKERLQNYTDLISSKTSILELSQKKEWQQVLDELESMRVAAMYASIQEGDTTDAKAYARAIDNIIAKMRGCSDDTEIRTLVDQYEGLKGQIREEESTFHSASMGLGATI